MTEEKDNKQSAEQDSQEEKKVEAEEKENKEQTTEENKKENSPSTDIEKNESKDKKTPDLKPGMTVCVYQKIKEMNIKGEEKERVQFFEGLIIAKKHGKEAGGSITVRKVSNGVGVEKIFPLNLPTIDKIEIKKESRVRRAKLYFLKRGYKKRLKEIKK